MNNEQRDKLRRNHTFLLSNLPTDEVLDELYEKDLFSRNDSEEIQVERVSSKKANQFLMLLTRKGPDAYPLFLDALQKINSRPTNHIYNTLENKSIDSEGHNICIGEIRQELDETGKGVGVQAAPVAQSLSNLSLGNHSETGYQTAVQEGGPHITSANTNPQAVPSLSTQHEQCNHSQAEYQTAVQEGGPHNTSTNTSSQMASSTAQQEQGVAYGGPSLVDLNPARTNQPTNSRNGACGDEVNLPALDMEATANISHAVDDPDVVNVSSNRLGITPPRSPSHTHSKTHIRPVIERQNTLRDTYINRPDGESMRVKYDNKPLFKETQNARGVFGTVCKGRLLVDKVKDEWEDVAIKEFTKHPENFHEAGHLAELTRHGNIVELHIAGQNEDGVYCVVTEYVKHGNLEEYIKENPVHNLEMSKCFVRQMAEGLRYLKKQSILHLDLKPANIGLTEPSESERLYKIYDFGSACKVTDDMKPIHRVGTVGYMSPEVIEGKESTTQNPEQADLWSLGATLYQVQSGKTLLSELEGQQPTYSEILKHYNTPKFQRSLTETLLKAHADEDLSDLICQLLQVDKESRVKWEDFINHQCINPHKFTHRDHMRAISTDDITNQLPIKELKKQGLVHDLDWLKGEIRLNHVRIGDQIWIHKSAAFGKICYWHVVVYAGLNEKGQDIVIELDRKHERNPDIVVKETLLDKRCKDKKLSVIKYESHFQGFLLPVWSEEWRRRTIELARKCIDDNCKVTRPVKYDISSSNCEMFATLLIVLTFHYYTQDVDKGLHRVPSLTDTVSSINATLCSKAKKDGKVHGLDARLMQPNLKDVSGAKAVFSFFGMHGPNEENYRDLRDELMARIEDTRTC